MRRNGDPGDIRLLDKSVITETTGIETFLVVVYANVLALQELCDLFVRLAVRAILAFGDCKLKQLGISRIVIALNIQLFRAVKTLELIDEFLYFAHSLAFRVKEMAVLRWLLQSMSS